MNFDKHLEEQLKDEEFKKEWEDLQPEYSIIDSLIKARLEQGITQKQLSEMTGIQQSNISRLESGNYNPTINFLKRIAKALGKNYMLNLSKMLVISLNNRLETYGIYFVQ